MVANTSHQIATGRTGGNILSRKILNHCAAALCLMSAPLLPLCAEPEGAETRNHGPVVVTADRSAACGEAIAQSPQIPYETGLPRTFSLLNWNVEKAQHPELIGAFAHLAKQADLIFIQEAVPVAKTETVISESLYQAFVRGYVQDEIDTGVLTLARSPHTVHCHLLATEPWLRTPKATSVTLYPLANSERSLLTVNMHAVNFAFGVSAYVDQLRALEDVIGVHTGPIIFGGDLNTWSESRQSALDAFAKEHNLTAVVFSPDHRTTRFGRALDHLYVRGLSWQSAAATPVTTSDHNPLMAELEYAGP